VDHDGTVCAADAGKEGIAQLVKATAILGVLCAAPLYIFFLEQGQFTALVH
jgi:hypothetical protein